MLPVIAGNGGPIILGEKNQAIRSTWVASRGPSVGMFTLVVLGGDGRAGIACYDADNGGLKVARYRRHSVPDHRLGGRRGRSCMSRCRIGRGEEAAPRRARCPDRAHGLPA